MNGIMISARPRVLMEVTFLKHFALKVWVSIVKDMLTEQIRIFEVLV